MQPRISMITLGVNDIERAVRFYEKGLGWHRLDSPPSVAFFDLNGTWLGLYGREALAEDAGVDAGEVQGFNSFALAHNLSSEGGVDGVMAQALEAGATLIKAPQKVFWGGYSGYFKDPEGHLWEVAHNPMQWIGPQDPPSQQQRIHQVGAVKVQPRHHASCHCGAVQLIITLPHGLMNPYRCNCSFCSRRGAVAATALVGDIEVMAGADKLTRYQFGTHTAEHHFCSVCGIYTHHRRRSNPNEFGFNVACLRDINVFELGEVAVLDGLHHPSDQALA